MLSRRTSGCIPEAHRRGGRHRPRFAVPPRGTLCDRRDSPHRWDKAQVTESDGRRGVMIEFDEDTRAKVVANKSNWDARAPIHARSEFYGIGSRDPASWFAPFEWRDLGQLDGREVLHLQCHLGTE